MKHGKRTAEKLPEKQLPWQGEGHQESGTGGGDERQRQRAAQAGEIYATINGLKDMMYGLAQAIEGLEAALEDFGEKQDGAGTDS